MQVTPQLLLEAGEDQLLNGEEALWFARYRADSSDYDRMLRQRCVVTALVEQTEMPEIAANFVSLADILGTNFSTNIQQSDLPAWLHLFEKTRAHQLGGFAFIPPEVDTANPDYQFIRGKVAEVVAQSEAAAEAATNQPTGTEKGATSAPETVEPVPTGTPDPSQTPETPAPPVDDNPYC